MYQVNNDGDSSDDDSLDDDEAEETALESYQTPLDEENCPVDEYVIFKQILQRTYSQLVFLIRVFLRWLLRNTCYSIIMQSEFVKSL